MGGQIYMIFKEIRMLWNVMVVVVKPGWGRSPTPEQADTGGIAHGTLTMGVSKKHTAFRESIDIRSWSLRMTAKSTDPIVQVIDCDKKNI